MENMIVTLLKRYESGGLTRRELVQGLMMVATGAATASTASRVEAQSGMKFDWAPLVDHIQVNASDVRKSTEFYQKALGLDLLRQGPPNDRNCCPDTSAFFGVGKRLILAVRANKPAGLTHHWALLMNGFDREAVTRELKARGVEPRMNPESGFHVVDPDGVEIQLMGQPGPA